MTFDTRAKNVAHKASDSKEVNNLLKSQILRDEEVVTGPIVLMYALLDAQGDDGFKGWPVPDSKTGNNADIYKEPYTRKDGKPSERSRSFYEDLAQDFAFGGEAFRKYEQLKEANKKQPDRSLITLPEIVQLLDDQNAVEIVRLMELWRKRATGFVNKIKKAVNLYMAAEDIAGLANDNNPLKLRYDFDDENNLKPGYSPVILSGVVEKFQVKRLTVEQVIRLGDPEVIAAVRQQATNRYVHLVNSLATGTQANASQKGTMINNQKEFHNFLAAVNNYLDTSDKTLQERYDALVAKMGTKSGEELVLAVGDAYHTLHDLFQAIEPRYKRLADTRAKETKEPPKEGAKVQPGEKVEATA